MQQECGLIGGNIFRNVVRQILADARADRWRARVRGVRAGGAQRRTRAA